MHRATPSTKARWKQYSSCKTLLLKVMPIRNSLNGVDACVFPSISIDQSEEVLTCLLSFQSFLAVIISKYCRGEYFFIVIIGSLRLNRCSLAEIVDKFEAEKRSLIEQSDALKVSESSNYFLLSLTRKLRVICMSSSGHSKPRKLRLMKRCMISICDL